MKLNNISIFKNEFKKEDKHPDYQAYGSWAEKVNGIMEYNNKQKIGGAWKKTYKNKDGADATFVSITLTDKNFTGTKEDGTSYTNLGYVLITTDEWDEFQSLKASKVEPKGYDGSVASTEEIDF